MNKHLDPVHIGEIRTKLISEMDILIQEFTAKHNKSQKLISDAKMGIIYPEKEHWDLDEEREHADLLLADLIDYRKIRNLIIQGNYKTAGETIELLDTAAREYIPDYVYNQLCEDGR